MIQDARIKILNRTAIRDGAYVLYWMQQAQRAVCNHALEYAVRKANHRGVPVVVVFGITSRFPGASERHYAFMLEGLGETAAALHDRGIRFVLRDEAPVDAVLALADDAALIVTDRGYLRVQKQWRRRVARRARCMVVQVESDVVVPVETASIKEEYAAATLRPKIEKRRDEFLVPLEATDVEHDALGLAFDGLPTDDVDAVLQAVRINRGIPRVTAIRGGAAEANRLLDVFVDEHLDDYADAARDPAANAVSHMSPYLHFGQMSPLEIALRVRDSGAKRASVDAYLEQLIVRRELSMNFCVYNSRYDQYAALPDWAKATLRAHRSDEREYEYSYEQFAAADTHDPYWNAAQREMVLAGKMHNYMRMYWGKKILEWTPEPEAAFKTALALNNAYELDGRDPNGFAGVAWCLGKHDRGWKERPVFGKVRYMNAAGLERKFDIGAYVARVDALEEDAG